MPFHRDSCTLQSAYLSVYVWHCCLCWKLILRYGLVSSRFIAKLEDDPRRALEYWQEFWLLLDSLWQQLSVIRYLHHPGGQWENAPWALGLRLCDRFNSDEHLEPVCFWRSPHSYGDLPRMDLGYSFSNPARPWAVCFFCSVRWEIFVTSRFQSYV